MTKRTVEQCLSISTRDVLSQRGGVYHGTVCWEWFGGRKSSIAYTTDWRNASPTLVLVYCDDADGNGLVRLPIDLQSTRLRHGGQRWWFLCPIEYDGMPCGRRCGTLHLPPSGDIFGCRQCHDLSYASSQDAHQLERLIDQIDRSSASWIRDIGMTKSPEKTVDPTS
ncbi:hypothetical protein Enr13x_32690 [Stieleria neptunia]|uniref:Uncharacterized protein n=1 Tax=Stieleria neptunia TaxID=2527979 RepID=A0A518HRD8_9BACT|nr:hypothetical protein [Stieleria neptunia]QDV43413.1 hypothetical protein Enr13x_32690 [Stieleria neptunia]